VFEYWGKWDGTEFDETKEEKNFRKQQEIWRNLDDKTQTNFYANFYGGNDKKDGAHPESKQFKDFEEALCV
jgi:hypothetical protein